MSSKIKLSKTLTEVRKHLDACKQCGTNPDGCKEWRNLARLLSNRYYDVLWDCILWHRHRGINLERLFTKMERIIKAAGAENLPDD